MYVSLSGCCKVRLFYIIQNVRTLLSSSCRSEGEGLEKGRAERRKEKDGSVYFLLNLDIELCHSLYPTPTQLFS